MLDKVKYLIIGGGISGLMFANFVEKDYLIVEKENEVGGYCRTIKNKDFVWDYAGHFYHFKTENLKQKFIDSIEQDDIVYQNKCTKICYKDTLIDYPFQSNIHQLEKQEFIDCLYDLFYKAEKEEYDNFLDMLYGKFGKSIVEKFLKPYNEKLYATDLKCLDKNAMGRFFPYANLKEIIKNMRQSEDKTSYNNTFLYPKKGAGAFVQVLYEGLVRENILLEHEVVEVDLRRKMVTLQNGRNIHYEYLINTSPLNQFLLTLSEDVDTKFKEILSYNQVLVFNLGFDKKSNFAKEHWLYVPDKNINFYRVGFYDNILNTDKLSMYVEIGFGKDEKIDVESQFKFTLENLKMLGIVSEDMKLEQYCSLIMSPAYVHISKESEQKVKEFMRAINEKDVYSIGRYGGWKYCSMEDCMLEAMVLADRLK